MAQRWTIEDVKNFDLELDDTQCKKVLADAPKNCSIYLLEHLAQNLRIDLIENGDW
jgi:hypothetical protein